MNSLFLPLLFLVTLVFSSCERHEERVLTEEEVKEQLKFVNSVLGKNKYGAMKQIEEWDKEAAEENDDFEK